MYILCLILCDCKCVGTTWYLRKCTCFLRGTITITNGINKKCEVGAERACGGVGRGGGGGGDWFDIEIVEKDNKNNEARPLRWVRKG